MHAFIAKNAEVFGFENIQVIKMDVFAFMQQCNEQFNFIFAGPPYALGNIDDLPAEVFKHKLLFEKGWFVLEHTPRNNYEQYPYFKTARHYGTTVFSIFINNV